MSTEAEIRAAWESFVHHARAGEPYGVLESWRSFVRARNGITDGCPCQIPPVPDPGCDFGAAVEIALTTLHSRVDGRCPLET